MSWQNVSESSRPCTQRAAGGNALSSFSPSARGATHRSEPPHKTDGCDECRLSRTSDRSRCTSRPGARAEDDRCSTRWSTSRSSCSVHAIPPAWSWRKYCRSSAVRLKRTSADDGAKELRNLIYVLDSLLLLQSSTALNRLINTRQVLEVSTKELLHAAQLDGNELSRLGKKGEVLAADPESRCGLAFRKEDLVGVRHTRRSSPAAIPQPKAQRRYSSKNFSRGGSSGSGSAARDCSVRVTRVSAPSGSAGYSQFGSKLFG